MVLRADGHFYLTNSGGAASTPVGRFLNTSTGGYLSVTGTWTNSSDKNKKEKFADIDRRELLERIAALPITRWNYKGDDVDHIGPVAQDFYALFGVGTDDNFFDLGGHSLLAMQVVSRLEQRHGVRLNPRELVLQPLGQLAAYFEERIEKNAPPPGRGHPETGAPRGLIQKARDAVQRLVGGGDGRS